MKVLTNESISASDYGQFFHDLTGKQPYPFQEQVADLILQRKSIIIRAPTGSGKSEAVFIPFMKARVQALPSQMIYSLPVRTLVDELSSRFVKLVTGNPANVKVVGHHGKDVQSPLFYPEVVVTTIDQTIGAYACTPLSMPVRHGNIPGGAVASAFLVFDEIHTLEPLLGLQAALILARHSSKMNVPFAVMSATMPDTFVSKMEKNLNAVVIECCEEDIPARKDRSVFINPRLDYKLSSKEILEQYASSNGKVLVVVNTVQRAQELYKDLSKNSEPEIILLHSRFLEEDRREKEKCLKTIFDPSSNKKGILISTQVVEVGLDISADLLLTEISPVDSLIQRAGRCARRGGMGEIQIFATDTPHPYSSNLVHKTSTEIERAAEQELDWELEKNMINRVLEEAFNKWLDPRNLSRILGRIAEGAFAGKREKVESAVRDILTCDVSIYDNPFSLEHSQQSVFSLQRIRLPIYTLSRFIDNKHPLLWHVELNNGNALDEKESVLFKQIKTGSEIYPSDFYVINSDHARYDPKVGLVLGEPGENIHTIEKSQKKEYHYSLREETWSEHVYKIIKTFREILKPRYCFSFQSLALALSISPEEMISKFEFALAVHDLGKLNTRWQKMIGMAGKPLAHSASRKTVHLPSHATISAYAVSNILGRWKLLGNALRAAIAHHHSVRASYVPYYAFIEKWDHILEPIVRKIEGLEVDLSLVIDKQSASTKISGMPSFEKWKLYRSYLLFSRILRLSDRIATAGSENAILCHEEWYGNV